DRGDFDGPVSDDLACLLCRTTDCKFARVSRMTELAGDKLNAPRARNALAAEDHLTLGTDCYGRDTSDLTLDSVTKTFSDAVAVQNVSFQAKSGEFISLLGPSGCGKT